MNPKDLTDDLIRKFLLGELSEEKGFEISECAFADRAVMDRIEIVEHDLIDDYVLDRLAPGERAAFEQVFMRSQERRRKIAIAKALENFAGQSRKRCPSE